MCHNINYDYQQNTDIINGNILFKKYLGNIDYFFIFSWKTYLSCNTLISVNLLLNCAKSHTA